MAETIKSHARRLREGWYDAYCPADLPGIDIGCATDWIHPNSSAWLRYDWLIDNTYDATTLPGIPAESFQTVYASHVLEHLDDPVAALRRWWDVLKPGGCLIVCVPHRDLYEKRRFLPSRWNGEHKHFWHHAYSEPPCTFCFEDTLRHALELHRASYQFNLYRVLDEGWVSNGEDHSGGEYSIEAVITKI